MNGKVLNMTEGNPTKLIIKFSIPMLIGNVFQQIYNLADSIIVGKLIGSDALAAIGVTSSVTFLFFALCNGFASGGGIITSQAFGSGNDSRTKRSIANTAYVMTIMPTIIGVTAFFLSEKILLMLKTPDTILHDAVLYTQTMCVGLAFVSIYNFASSMLRALGDSKTPLYFLVFSCFLNVLLDLIFILCFHMGVFGAGIATVISQFVSASVCLGYAIKANPYFHMSCEEREWDSGIIVKIVKLGVPLSLQFSLIAISCMALQRTVNSFGEVAVAAFTATSRIEQMIHQPYQTLSAALATYCGQNYGAGKNKRVIHGYRRSMLLMVIFTAVMVPLIQLFSRPIVRLFVNDAPVIDMGAKAMQITSIFYIFLGVIYVVRGILNGLGDASFALLNGIVEVIGRFTVPIAMTMMPIFGLWGIWWSVGVVWFISGFTAWLRYLSYKRKAGLSADRDAVA